MIEWINCYFGIDNSVSVPIIISLLVFTIGGISKVILNWISSYRKNKNTRFRFASLIDQICANLKQKISDTNDFYPTIIITHTSGWHYTYKPISYLEIIYQIDFNEIHNAYYAKFKFSFSRKEKEDVFHQIWDNLANIKFVESHIEKSLNGLGEQFTTFHNVYRENLSLYQEFHEELLNKINGTQIPHSNSDLINYLEGQENIWNEWHELKEGEREFSHITYEKIVNPIFKLNQRFPEVEIAHNSSKFILKCEHAYAEMKNVLENYNSRFKGFAFQYEKSRNALLDEILKIK